MLQSSSTSSDWPPYRLVGPWSGRMGETRRVVSRLSAFIMRLDSIIAFCAFWLISNASNMIINQLRQSYIFTEKILTSEKVIFWNFKHLSTLSCFTQTHTLLSYFSKYVFIMNLCWHARILNSLFDCSVYYVTAMTLWMLSPPQRISDIALVSSDTTPTTAIITLAVPCKILFTHYACDEFRHALCM